MKFKKILKMKNISGYRLSKISNVQQQRISKYTSEKVDIMDASFSTIIRICDALELSLDEFRKLLEE